MRCSKAKRQIELKLDNELRQGHALELHLQNCASCRAYQAESARLQLLLNNQPQPEFPGWLHHRIMDQAAQHDSQRIHLKHSFRLQTIPALAAIALSLFLGVAIGKNVYRSVNPLPANAAEVYSQTAGFTPSQELAVFGESSVAGDLF
ncbi:MAG: hypothetical protein PHG32_02535 [Candidatus Cloacimonetes bacterium]|nr:hypothetical protein [Candidatus Cloacimonadota bacterium]